MQSVRQSHFLSSCRQAYLLLSRATLIYRNIYVKNLNNILIMICLFDLRVTNSNDVLRLNFCFFFV